MHSAFSIFHLAEFVTDNVQYETNEHYIQSKKASLFDNDLTQQKILTTCSSYEAKKLGYHVKNYNLVLWNNEAKRIALKGAYAKFTQNGLL